MIYCLAKMMIDIDLWLEGVTNCSRTWLVSRTITISCFMPYCHSKRTRRNTIKQVINLIEIRVSRTLRARKAGRYGNIQLSNKKMVNHSHLRCQCCQARRVFTGTATTLGSRLGFFTSGKSFKNFLGCFRCQILLHGSKFIKAKK